MAAYVSVIALVRLMRHRRDQLIAGLRKQVAREQTRRRTTRRNDRERDQKESDR